MPCGRFGVAEGVTRAIRFVVLALLLASLTFGLSAQERANLIVIMADDLGFECLSANGGLSYETPHLDRLAATGVRFTNAHAQPLCTPTRVQVMTGQYNVRNYVGFGQLKRDEITFGNLLRDAGYATAIAGKWQLGRVAELPKQFGFDEHVLWQHTRFAPRYPNPGLEVQSEPRDYTNGEYGPDLINAFALDFITKQAKDKSKPFLLYYPMILPHFPHQATPDSAAWDPKVRGENKARNPAYFVDMVRYMDKMVGNVVAKLEELELRDNTLVLFVGDNGTNVDLRSRMHGYNVRGGKRFTTVRGTHVPMIANWPGRIMPSVCGDLVDTTDFLPTLCEAAGVIPVVALPLDGRSFLPQLFGKKGNPREWIYCWYSPRGEPLQVFAYDKKFKLYRTGALFDYRDDPLERRALARDARPVVRSKLRAALKKYESARPAGMPWPGNNQGANNKPKKGAGKKK
ncbi:MAG: arylsulfatase A [Planctomycetota bacterium]|jgi:arylsulfatase A